MKKTKLTKTSLAMKLWDYLELHCKGQACAVKQQSIAGILGITVREVRLLTKTLGTKLNKPVASTVHPPYGIYIPANKKETGEYIAQLDARIKALFARRRAFSRSTAVDVVRQMEFGDN